jgi:predicted MPP superfamily phosphohydrolase
LAKLGFQIGLSRPLEIREEVIRDRASPLRLAYVSDIHLRRGRSARLANQVVDALVRARPAVILLGGDLVDQLSEIKALRELIIRLQPIAPVFAIPGNHDVAVGVEWVREAVVAAGACWIEGRAAPFHHGGRVFSICGPGGDPDITADVRVLCAHNPSIWNRARAAGFDLVLAGHLHGCQAVLFEVRGKLYPGAFFYPYNFIRHAWRNSHLVVSMGCSDLIPVRWRCPREIVLCLI